MTGQVGEPLSESDLRRLRYLSRVLEGVEGEVRYLDYAQVEEATENLAKRLLDEIGASSLYEWAFRPIPRGGLIVLGLLSYLLDLDPGQLSHPYDSRRTVVVDDVALSGTRLRNYVEDFDGDQVVFAHLASTPELRAVVEAEPAVRACIGAVDLRVLDAEKAPDQVDELRRLWRERLGDDRYWYGHPELIAFPWSEPDQMLWDPSTGEVEKGWSLVSPEKSLKTRGSLGPPSPAHSRRALRFPREIAFGGFDDGYLLCRLDTEEVFKLDSSAAAMWGALGTLGDVDAVTAYIEEMSESDSGAVPAFADKCVEAGILERTAD